MINNALSLQTMKVSKDSHEKTDQLVGRRVRLMDSNDTAIVVRVENGMYWLDIDGLERPAHKSEFVLVEEQQDILLYSSTPAIRSKDSQQSNSGSKRTEVTVDLHFEKIPGHEYASKTEALKFQLDYFRRILDENLKHRGMHITFIHGIGDGVLRDAIRNELQSKKYKNKCSCTFNSNDKTNVTIR